MEEKKSLFVRCINGILKVVTNKKVLTIYMIVANIWLIFAVITCNYLEKEYLLPFEERTNFEFMAYADFILEDISIMVIEEGEELRLEHVPYTVSEYTINYTNNVIEFWYCLDKEEIISQYKMITGKEPYEIPEDKELEKTIWMTDEFQIVYETSLFDNIPPREVYTYKQNIAIAVDTILRDVFLILALGFILLLVINCTVNAYRKKRKLS